MIADGTWRTQFGADPAIVGRKPVIDGESKSVVGVLQRGFVFPYEADLWYPRRADRPSASPWSFHAPAWRRAMASWAIRRGGRGSRREPVPDSGRPVARSQG